MVTLQQMWERACPAKRRAGGARYHRRRNCYGEHLEAFMQPEAKPSLLHTQLSIIHQPGDGHNPSTPTVPARDAGFDAEQRMGTVLALVESGLANGEPGVFCCHCSIPWNFSDAWAGLFAGMPAPTGSPQASRPAPYLWERACPRKGPIRRHIDEVLS